MLTKIKKNCIKILIIVSVAVAVFFLAQYNFLLLVSSLCDSELRNVYFMTCRNINPLYQRIYRITVSNDNIGVYIKDTVPGVLYKKTSTDVMSTFSIYNQLYELYDDCYFNIEVGGLGSEGAVTGIGGDEFIFTLTGKESINTSDVFQIACDTPGIHKIITTERIDDLHISDSKNTSVEYLHGKVCFEGDEPTFNSLNELKVISLDFYHEYQNESKKLYDMRFLNDLHNLEEVYIRFESDAELLDFSSVHNKKIKIISIKVLEASDEYLKGLQQIFPYATVVIDII